MMLIFSQILARKISKIIVNVFKVINKLFLKENLMIFKLNVSTSIRKKDQCNETFQIMRINVAYNSFLRIYYYYFYKFASVQLSI